MEVFDVVVVGAGPAGLMASKKIAEKGSNVLLLEKEKTVGKKPCGEAVSENGVKDAEAHFDEKVLLNKITGAHVYAPDESKKIEIFREIEEIGSGYILDKKRFSEILLDESLKHGTKIRFGTEAVGFRKNGELMKITLKPEGEVYSKVVLGCDGFNSIVRKTFFQQEKIELISCIQYAMKNCRVEDEDIMKFYFGSNVAPLGYLWVFPKGNGLANVGVGVRKGVAKDYLDRFIKEHPDVFANAETLNVSGAPVIVSGQLNKIVQDNIVLCGESAGQVIPLTGAGIHTALVSGRISGEVVVEALEENEYTETKLSEYVNKFNTVYDERIRKSRKALMALEKLSDGDLNKLAELLTGTDVLDLANGTNIERVAKKLLPHPILAARVARALLS